MKQIIAIVLVSFLSLYANPAVAQSPGSQQYPSEISVGADAWAWVAPDTVRITLLAEGSGANATAAFKDLRSKSSGIIDALKKTKIKALRITDRGNQLRGGETLGTPITKNTTVKTSSFIGVETREMDKVQTVIDSALKAGASTIKEVDYLVRNDSVARVEAVNAATKKAKIKAEAMARTLGVELGDLLSAAVTEEPEGRRLRLQRQRGENTTDYSDKEIHAFVNLRYAIER